MNYYNRHIGDYAKQTAHLTFAEDGAYNRMLDYYYSTEQPLPLDRELLYRKVRARSRPEREMIDRLLAEFFTERSDGWRKNRCDEEIEKYHVKADANRKNGTRGGRPKKPNDNPTETHSVSKENPNETLASSQEPRTKNRKPETSKVKNKVAAWPLPDWLPPEPWAAYVEMRKRIKKPLTEDAVPLALKKLEELRAEGHDPKAVLEWAIFNSYQGLFPPKVNGGARPTVTSGNIAAGHEWLRSEREKDEITPT